MSQDSQPWKERREVRVPAGSCGVAGAGIMGSGIAETVAASGAFERVVLQDIDPDQLERATTRIAANLDSLTERGKLDAAERDRTLARIRTATDFGALADCSFAIEAVPESFEIKAEVLRAISAAVSPEAMIATNTSAIPVTRLAGCVERPERFLGMHFMNPAPQMKGLELVRGLRTSAATRAAALELGARFGKRIACSKDRAGFTINRILLPMLNDAIAGLDAGLGSIGLADRYVKSDESGPRHPMGPFMLADLIGLDTVAHTLAGLAAELDDAFAPAALLLRLTRQGAHGRKSGGGFYLWPRNRPPRPNPLVDELAAEKSRDDGVALGRRAWLTMANEALKVVGEGTSTVADTDCGCLYCLNHPVGIFAALDRMGENEALAALERCEQEFGRAYKPAPLLRRMVEAGFGGRTAGAGAYRWQGNEMLETNAVLQEYTLAPVP